MSSTTEWPSGSNWRQQQLSTLRIVPEPDVSEWGQFVFPGVLGKAPSKSVAGLEEWMRGSSIGQDLDNVIKAYSKPKQGASPARRITRSQSRPLFASSPPKEPKSPSDLGSRADPSTESQQRTQNTPLSPTGASSDPRVSSVPSEADSAELQQQLRSSPPTPTPNPEPNLDPSGFPPHHVADSDSDEAQFKSSPPILHGDDLAHTLPHSRRLTPPSQLIPDLTASALLPGSGTRQSILDSAFKSSEPSDDQFSAFTSSPSVNHPGDDSGGTSRTESDVTKILGVLLRTLFNFHADAGFPGGLSFIVEAEEILAMFIDGHTVITRPDLTVFASLPNGRKIAVLDCESKREGGRDLFPQRVCHMLGRSSQWQVRKIDGKYYTPLVLSANGTQLRLAVGRFSPQRMRNYASGIPGGSAAQARVSECGPINIRSMGDRVIAAITIYRLLLVQAEAMIQSSDCRARLCFLWRRGTMMKEIKVS